MPLHLPPPLAHHVINQLTVITLGHSLVLEIHRTILWISDSIYISQNETTYVTNVLTKHIYIGSAVLSAPHALCQGWAELKLLAKN